MVLSDQCLEGTLDENGAKCISLVLAEAETNKEEFGEFLFKKDGRAQLDFVHTVSITVMWTVPGQQRYLSCVQRGRELL